MQVAAEPIGSNCEAFAPDAFCMNSFSKSVPLRFLHLVVMLAGFVPAVFAAAEPPLPDWAIGPFTRPENAGPVIRPKPESTFDCPMRKQPVAWEARHTFNPAAVLRDGRIHVLYRAEDNHGAGIGGYTSRLGLGTSEDGIRFVTEPKPVFFPADDAQKEFEWEGGCEDPRLAEGPDGVYVITYTQFARRNNGSYRFWRIGLAASKDLRTWTKYDGAFAETPFENRRIKSASILHRVENGRLIAAKVNGKYWMYFGESSVNLATSDDLVHWTPVTDAQGKLLEVMKTRRGFFDSVFTEVGPPAILTPRGIVLIYNGKNSKPGNGGDPSLPGGVYTCGQALFDKNDPAKSISRLDNPFFKPELDWERTGQYSAGTTFAEGLVLFKGRWFLYYGCADTFVGVAIAEGKPWLRDR